MNYNLDKKYFPHFLINKLLDFEVIMSLNDGVLLLFYFLFMLFLLFFIESFVDREFQCIAYSNCNIPLYHCKK